MIPLLCRQLLRGNSLFTVALFLCTTFLLSSCKKDKKGDEYTVKYTVTCTGTFKNGNPKISYNDASGNTATAEATIGTAWVKELSVSRSYPIKASVSGTFDNGEVILSVEGYKNGSPVDVGESSQSSTIEQAINISYESKFE